MKITEHFDSDEFKCHDGTPYPAEWVDERLRPLCETLEVIRAQLGRPVVIDSGFRTLAYDAALYEKSAKDGLVATPQGSQHPKGRAADIRVKDVSPALLHRTILDLFKAGKLPHLGGIGLYPNFVHVDIRDRGPGNHLAQWGGQRDSNIV